MTAPFKIRKLANAFSKSNKPSTAISDIAIGGGAALSVIEGYRKKHGGLWVGGVVELNSDGVFFSANALNKALHSGATGRRVPIEKIRSVHWEFGWVVAASVYGPLTAAQALSLPVFLKAESGGWPPPSFLGWVLVALIWATIWWGVASFLTYLIKKYRAKA